MEKPSLDVVLERFELDHHVPEVIGEGRFSKVLKVKDALFLALPPINRRRKYLGLWIFICFTWLLPSDLPSVNVAHSFCIDAWHLLPVIFTNTDLFIR